MHSRLSSPILLDSTPADLPSRSSFPKFVFLLQRICLTCSLNLYMYFSIQPKAKRNHAQKVPILRNFDLQPRANWNRAYLVPNMVANVCNFDIQPKTNLYRAKMVPVICDFYLQPKAQLNRASIVPIICSHWFYFEFPIKIHDSFRDFSTK